jgi:hypothetical protein
LIVDLLNFIAFAFGPVLFLLNFGLAVFAKGLRCRHVMFVLTFIAAAAFSSGMNELHIQKRHRWFVQEGIRSYKQVVQEVLQNRLRLTSDSQFLHKIIDRPFAGSASTNSDGSLTVYFPGGEGGPRHGYLYHSGGQLAHRPGDTNAYFLHLTNGWYEY